MSYLTNGRGRRRRRLDGSSVGLVLTVLLGAMIGWLAVLGLITAIGWLL